MQPRRCALCVYRCIRMGKLSCGDRQLRPLLLLAFASANMNISFGCSYTCMLAYIEQCPSARGTD